MSWELQHFGGADFRRNPQETADFRRNPQETADFRRNPFVPFSLSLSIPPVYSERGQDSGYMRAENTKMLERRGVFRDFALPLAGVALFASQGQESENEAKSYVPHKYKTPPNPRTNPEMLPKSSKTEIQEKYEKYTKITQLRIFLVFLLYFGFGGGVGVYLGVRRGLYFVWGT